MSATIIVIEMGQSNSCGQADNSTIDASYKQVFSNIQTWTGSAFESLNYANGNNRYPTVTTVSGSVFAITSGIQSHYGGTIYHIKYGIGGTYLGTHVSASVNWNTATRGSYYDSAVSTINAAMAYLWNTLSLRDYKFFIFWDQGESDARSITDASNYQTNLTNLITGIRNNLLGNGSHQCVCINPRVNTSVTPVSGGTGITVTAASNASPIVITSSASHGLATNMTVTIAGVTGNTAANGTWTITVLTATTFRLNSSTGNGAYVSGGTINSWTQMGAVNTAQQAIDTTDSNFYSYNTNTFQLSSDNLHYDATGYKDKGLYAVNNIIIANNL